MENGRCFGNVDLSPGKVMWAQRKIRLFTCLIVIALFISGCSSVSYHWYTKTDATIKLSIANDRVIRMLIILNYSNRDEVKKLESEKELLKEELDVHDYFDYEQNQSDFLLVHYTEGNEQVVGFYNFNFASRDFDLGNEKVITILKHFGMMEAADKNKQKISYSKLLEADAFMFRSILIEGTKQVLKEPNWYDERFAKQ